MARNVMLNTKKRSPNLVTIFFYVMDSFHIQSRKIYDNIFINMLDVYCNLFYFISFGTWCWTWKMDWSSIWGGGCNIFLTEWVCVLCCLWCHHHLLCLSANPPYSIKPTEYYATHSHSLKIMHKECVPFNWSSCTSTRRKLIDPNSSLATHDKKMHK